MPELPEVERGRRVASGVARGRTISEIVCADDEIVYPRPQSQGFARVLRGRTVLEIKRWGKQLWFVLDKGYHPLFHFGMTGGFHTRNDIPLQLKSGPKEIRTEWPPSFTKLHLWFNDGGELVFADPRRLGRILLRDRPEQEPPISRLGFDPIHSMLESQPFRELIQSRASIIKSLLLDQSTVAGIGNWIADEVLYQSGIDPRRPANTLSNSEIERLRETIRDVISHAVECNADEKKYPETWLFHRRWGRKSGATTINNEPIQHLTIAGRTTAWVPSAQS